MKNPYQLLIIPLTFWSGMEQGFFGADYTAVSYFIVYSTVARNHGSLCLVFYRDT